MNHMAKAEGTHYRDELLSKVIDICSQNNYQYITNFEWYISVLVELTRMEGGYFFVCNSKANPVNYRFLSLNSIDTEKEHRFYLYVYLNQKNILFVTL